MMRSVIEAAPMIIRAVGVIAVVASLLGAGAVRAGGAAEVDLRAVAPLA